MKNRKNKFIKIGILLFGISLIIWNCDRNEYIPIIQESVVSQKVTKTTFQEFLKNPKFKSFNEKHNLNIYLETRTLKKGDNISFIINANTVKKVNYGNSVSYNFYIERDTKDKNIIENLVVIKTKDMITAFIAKYKYKSVSAKSFSRIHQNLDQVEVNPIDNNNDYQLNEFLKNHYLDGSGGSQNCRVVFIEETRNCNGRDSHTWEEYNQCTCGELPSSSCSQKPSRTVYRQEICEPNDNINIDNTNSDPNSSDVGSGSSGSNSPTEYDAVTVITTPETYLEYLNDELSHKSPFNVNMTQVVDSISLPPNDSTRIANEKFLCLYNKLTTSNTFKNLFVNVFGNTQNVLNIKFKITKNLKHDG